MSAQTIETLPIAEIAVPPRLREIDQGWVEAMAQSITEIGQKSPIEVVRAETGYRLVAGAHRLAAIKWLGREDIRAVVSSLDDVEAELAEIDENLIRRELGPLDRAVFLARRKYLYEKVNPETRAGVAGGRARQGAANEMFSFAAETAKKIRLGRRAIERAVRIGALDKDVRARISGTWLAGKEGELYALAKHSPARQMQIITMLLDEQSPVRSVKAAARVIDGHVEDAPSPEEEQLARLMDAWRRAGAKARREFRDYINSSECVRDV